MQAVDLFAGAGGWSQGWLDATGHEPVVAINHDPHAVHLHRLNHPSTEHFLEDVWQVDPTTAIRGRSIDWLHLSPACTHFSAARGGKPNDEQSRSQANVGLEWAKAPSPGDAKLSKCERAILAVLAQHADGCRSGKLTLLAGYTWSGGFRNSLATLRTAGLIEGGNGDVMRATQAGLLAAAGVEPLPTGADIVDHWRSHPAFGACERKIIDALLARREGLCGAELAAATGYEWSGGFRNALSALRTAGVLVGKNGETMRLCDDLLAAAAEKYAGQRLRVGEVEGVRAVPWHAMSRRIEWMCRPQMTCMGTRGE